MNTTNNPWQTLSSQEIYDNPWISLTEHQVINPNGGRGIYGSVHFKNIATGILALDEFRNIWLVGQYRFSLKQYSWEIPEGGSPLDTNPLESAKRELLEETGIRAQNWIELQRMHLSNSVSDELGIIYLATDLSYGNTEPEETEQLQTRKIPFEQAYHMVISNQITDSMSVAAIFKLKILIMEGKI